MNMRGSSLLGFLIIIGVLFSCARNPVTGKKEMVLMSEKQEVAIGKEADPQIQAAYGLYNDQALQEYIQLKGEEMAVISHRPRLTYTFRVLDSPVVNAFALPGGYVYFTRGILAQFNNEAEFMGVLGHEIGHITARHGVRQHRNTLLSQLGLIAGITVFPELSQFAGEASQGLQMLMLKFGRDAERQSDELGVEYATKVNYDAHALAGFFQTLERMQAESGSSGLPSFLSTHPSPQEREVSVGASADEWAKKLGARSLQINRNAYLQLIDGLVYGEDPRQGFVEDQVFYHPVLKFQFPIPTSWSYQNSPQQVQMAPKDGRALMILNLLSSETLEEAATELVKRYNLELINHRLLKVNGLEAMAVEAGQQQENTVVRVLAYLIKYEGRIYNLLGAANSEDFDTFLDSFKNSMRNFKPLSDPEKLDKQPERIAVKTVGQTRTLEQVLSGFGVGADRLEEMAVLNGKLLADPVEKGSLIKVIE